MEDKFVLHWLDNSRSHRTLWMLDLLKLDYEVKVYLRHPETWRGPKSLFKVHPLGKAPILEIHFADGTDPLQLVESGFIMQYLLKYYDPEGLLTPDDEAGRLMLDYYLHYAEGSLEHILMALLINSTAKTIAPFGMKSIAKLVANGLNQGYYIHEYRLNMDYLEAQLIENGTGYFISNKLTAADIILSFPIYENLFDNEDGVKECTGDKRDIYKLWPNLGAWCIRVVRNDPSYKKISKMMDEMIQAYELELEQHKKSKKRR
jgi:glutathione S-transferase